jgi:short-subunit dehydrogenase
MILTFQGYFESLRTEKLGTGIAITLLCPGPVFSNLLKVAATDKPGQVSCMLRGRLHVSHFVYDFVYDFKYNLH